MVTCGVAADSFTTRLRRLAPRAAIPIAFGIIALAAPALQFHWDTLERAYLLEHPLRYLRTWDGSPRSQFLSFAHVLELPLAAGVRVMTGGGSGLRALCVFEVVAAVSVLLVVGRLVEWWRARTANGNRRDALWAALAAQATLAVAIAFWRMGSSGEEKILALATQVLFLACFWRALWFGTLPGAAPARVQRVRRAALVAGIGLAIAILSHLSAAVLVPFALLALWWLPAPWRTGRSAVARGVVAGTAVAGVAYAAVAAWTTHVRTPREFWDYLTFFHRPGGIDFFDTSAAELTAWARLQAAWNGLGSFFAAPDWARAWVAIALAAAILGSAWWHRRRHGAPDPAWSLLVRHALVLGGLWTAHFLFFEPENPESWTLVATLVIVVAAVSLPGRMAATLALLPIALVATNWRGYAALREPLPYAPYRSVVERGTRADDIVVLTGGTQGGQALRGSLVMRYFLALGPHREYASLYDIIGISGSEYWPAPFRSPAALQAAIDAGRRAIAPRFVRGDIERANASGIVHIETAPAGDSLLAITRIEARTPQ